MDEEVAFDTGLTIGHLMRYGIDAVPVLDPVTGNYTDTIEIPLGPPWNRQIRVRVLPR